MSSWRAGGSFQLLSVDEGDAGAYRCRARNRIATALAHITNITVSCTSTRPALAGRRHLRAGGCRHGRCVDGVGAEPGGGVGGRLLPPLPAPPPGRPPRRPPLAVVLPGIRRKPLSSSRSCGGKSCWAQVYTNGSHYVSTEGDLVVVGVRRWMAGTYRLTITHQDFPSQSLTSRDYRVSVSGTPLSHQVANE